MNKIDEISQKVNQLLAPYPVYLIGGCTRDTLLGKEPKDWDGCTPAPVAEIEALVRKAGRRPFITGRRFGTIGFKLQLDNKEWVFVEITQYRKEKYSSGNRKPQVEFISDLREDISRRDFTISGIAYREGLYTDFYGGRLDILAKKIKSIGDSRDRFRDDPLRLLRVARFAAQLDFEVDPNLIGKARAMADKVLTVSRERWMIELDKLLVQDKAQRGIDVLKDTHVLRFVLPEVWLLIPDHYVDLLERINVAPQTPEDRWAAMLSIIGRPFAHAKEAKDGRMFYTNQHLIAYELAKGIALRLKWSNDRADYVLSKLNIAGDF